MNALDSVEIIATIEIVGAIDGEGITEIVGALVRAGDIYG
jgi:hypothetical protein